MPCRNAFESCATVSAVAATVPRSGMGSGFSARGLGQSAFAAHSVHSKHMMVEQWCRAYAVSCMRSTPCASKALSVFWRSIVCSACAFSSWRIFLPTFRIVTSVTSVRLTLNRRRKLGAFCLSAIRCNGASAGISIRSESLLVSDACRAPACHNMFSITPRSLSLHRRFSTVDAR